MRLRLWSLSVGDLIAEFVPSRHAAGEYMHLSEACLCEELGGSVSAATGAAYCDDLLRTIRLQFFQTFTKSSNGNVHDLVQTAEFA